MKTLLACLLLLCSSSPGWAAEPAGAPTPMAVHVDTRVEIASVMARLAGFEEYQAAGLADYDAAVEAHFAAFEQHPAIVTLRTLRSTHGIGYAAPLELALAVAEPASWRPTIPARLAAGTRYRLQLNSEDAIRIKAADGAPLSPRTWTFEAVENPAR